MYTISINNENLANYVMFKLNKIDNNFTEQELNKIEEIVIDYDNEEESCFTFLEELIKFKNLKNLTLRNGYIFNDNYEIFLNLGNLSELTFDNCKLENADLISVLHIKSLSLINCKIANYDFINIIESLEELTIINGQISIKKLNMLNNLKYLQLSYSDIIENAVLTLDKLEELYIDNTNIDDFSFASNLLNLKIISIDEKQYNNNKAIFENMIKNKIKVLDNNFGEFGGENNE